MLELITEYTVNSTEEEETTPTQLLGGEPLPSLTSAVRQNLSAAPRCPASSKAEFPFPTNF